jgi:hypothetical protein
MKMKDLFPPRTAKSRPAKPQPAGPSKSKAISLAALAADKGLPESFLRQLGVEDHRRGVLIPYRREEGTCAERRRLRIALKAKEGSRWEGTGPLLPYGLDRLADAREAGLLVVVEGESDTWTLWHHGYPALGLPGAETSGLLQGSHLLGIERIFIIREPDAAGEKFVRSVAARSGQIGWPGKIYEVKLPDAKDPNALHLKSPADFKTAFQTALDAAAEVKTVAPTSGDAATAVASPADAEWRDPNGRYLIKNDQIFQIRFDREGYEYLVRLSNFAAKIVEETVLDDGAEESMVLSIMGRKVGGRLLPLVRVLVAKFPIMNWALESWGVGAYIEPGLGAKDHLRAAIQINSGDDIPRRTIFKHTGWRLINAIWYYLSGGGAIGPKGVEPSVEVNLPPPLSRYVLPPPPETAELIVAIKASLGMLGVAPRRITFPCLATTYRAVLGDSDLGIHVAGPSGAHKTGLTALCQQHYGATMDERHLPGSWSSTGNSLEALAFGAKDALLTIDDFAPTGSSNDVQRTHRDADRVFRAQGNQSGRQRLNSDSTLKTAKPPRGLIQSTGEDIPKGQSLRARILIIEMSRTDIDLERLTACQKDAAAGLYAQSLSGFVSWLAPFYGDVRERLLAERNELANAASRTAAHRRTPRIIADLALGLRYFLNYAVALGAITDAERLVLWNDGWKALGEAANAQAKHQNACDPAVRFIELLSSALSTGEAHLANDEGGAPEDAAAWGWRERVDGAGGFARQTWQSQGKRIGWIEGENLYLDPDGSFAAAQEMGRKGSDGLTITSQTLRKRLHEGGLLSSIDTKRETLTIRRMLEGRTHDVLHLNLACLSSAKEPDKPDIGAVQVADAGQAIAGNNPNNVGNVRLKSALEEPAAVLTISEHAFVEEDDAREPDEDEILPISGSMEPEAERSSRLPAPDLFGGAI